MDKYLTEYADQNPQIADVSLVYLGELRNIDTIFTVDRRDFSILRRTDGSAFTIVP